MAIKIIRIHETEKGYISEGEQIFIKRIQRFTKLEIITIQLPKKMNQLPPAQLKSKEAEKILNQISTADYVIVLDEKGKEYKSREFAKFIDNKMATTGSGDLIFVIGGAFGFDQSVYERSNIKLSLSKMTTSHQLIRILFLEQLYRAFTIIHNHPYHND